MLRNQITGWQPLHEAAWKGSLACVTALVDGHSPLRPRTPKNETPADLARAGGHASLAEYLEQQDEPLNDPRETCEVLEVDRDAARAMLAGEANPDGAFLIRKSRCDEWCF